jgi:Protein of unknown function (DUF2530)
MRKERPARRPTPEPLETNEVAIAIGGSIAWAIGFAVLAVFFRGDLQRHHATWWLWACALGVGLGLYGLRFALRRRSR